jgi:Uma2 family endonuclease
MAMLVFDPAMEDRLKAEREESGADRYDEVWEGVYMMAPLADDEHQDLQTKLGAIFQLTIGWPGLGLVRTGVNVSDREQGWTKNYRIPDVAVAVPDGAVRNCGTHWVGGPDFAIEIASPGDRSRDKLDFYGANHVRELLLIDRDPWKMELYRAAGAQLRLVGRSELQTEAVLNSDVVPLEFRLVAGNPRPQIEVRHTDGVQRWLV